MRTSVVILLAAIGWALVLTLVSKVAFQPLIPAAEGVRPGPWPMLAHLLFVVVLSGLAGFAVGRLAPAGHWAGAILGLLLSSAPLLVAHLFWPRPIPLSLVVLGIATAVLLLPPAWFGAWLGSRKRPVGRETDTERVTPAVRGIRGDEIVDDVPH